MKRVGTMAFCLLVISAVQSAGAPSALAECGYGGGGYGGVYGVGYGGGGTFIAIGVPGRGYYGSYGRSSVRYTGYSSSVYRGGYYGGRGYDYYRPQYYRGGGSHHEHARYRGSSSSHGRYRSGHR